MVNIEKFESLGFNKSQLKQIEMGIKSGLSDADIERFAKKEYPSTKMERIRKALKYGFTDEQIELYSDKKYDEYDLDDICSGIENGLSIDDIKLCLKPIYRKSSFYANNTAMKLIKDCNKGVFNEAQANQIRLGMQHDVSMKDIQQYAKPNNTYVQMMYMRLGFENHLSKSQMQILNSVVLERHDYPRIDEILNGLSHNLTNEQVLKYAKKGYGPLFMRQIRLAYEHGCTEEQVDYLISKIDTAYNDGCAIDWNDYIANYEEIPNPYRLDMFKDSENRYGWDMAVELRHYLELGLPLESVKKVFDNIHNYNNVRLIRRALFCGYTFDEAMNMFPVLEYGDNQRDVLFHAISHKLPVDCLKLMLDNGFDYLQMIEMLEGFLAHLSSEQVSVYAHTWYDYLQMAEMRTGFICGLSIDEVKQYADPELTSVEMALKRAEILSAK